LSEKITYRFTLFLGLLNDRSSIRLHSRCSGGLSLDSGCRSFNSLVIIKKIKIKQNKGEGYRRQRKRKRKTHGSRNLLDLGGFCLDSGGGGSLYGLDLLNGGNGNGGFRGRHYGRTRREL